MRYARQVVVPGVGEAGQRKIRGLEVRIDGDDLAAEVCARYLAGAGVRRLVVAPGLVPRIRGINQEVRIDAGGEAPLQAELARTEDPLLDGSRAARRVLAAALSGGEP